MSVKLFYSHYCDLCNQLCKEEKFDLHSSEDIPVPTNSYTILGMTVCGLCEEKAEEALRRLRDECKAHS